jgi:ABC-type lipoprotein release transport system permease subunit
MYKLFLTLRFLTRKKIVVFPILVVWLCLMMMIIVTSIMGGFVDRVKETNREVLGDIIISSDLASGWSGYDDLQKELKKAFPEIIASTPVVRAHALANVPQARQTVPAEVIGIDPVARSKVSRFRETLFKEYISPREAADDLSKRFPATAPELVEYARHRFDAAEKELQASSDAVQLQREKQDMAARGHRGNPLKDLNYWWLLGLLLVGLIVFLAMRPRPSRTGWSVVWGGFLGCLGLVVVVLGTLWPVIFPRGYELAEDRNERAIQALARAERTVRFAVSLEQDGNRRFTSKEELQKLLTPPEPSFQTPPVQLKPGERPPEGCIVGVQMGFFPRDKRGNFNRANSIDRVKMLITVFPASEKTGALSVDRSITRPFMIVDDSYSGVFDIDLSAVYAPFETVQIMAGMRADPDIVKDNPDAAFPPRTNEVLIKLKPGTDSNEMKLTRARISDFVEQYQATHPDMDPFPMKVQTWDERQAKYLSAVENEKVMQTFILGLMSLVVLVVIFLIIYMIVRDKTRDIGIIKAIGGSEEGVAGIFLIYGGFIGVVGGILGVICGVAFVLHTNEIHEWIYQMTGVVIWDRSVYLFDRIPDTVRPKEVAVYFCLAVLAGIIGALIPACVAASEDPVKAVRYE